MNNPGSVWVVDDDKSIRWVLEKALTKEKYDVSSFDSPDKLLAEFAEKTPDVIISDIRMPGSDGITLLEKIKLKSPDTPVIIMTAYSDVSIYKVGYLRHQLLLLRDLRCY